MVCAVESPKPTPPPKSRPTSGRPRCPACASSDFSEKALFLAHALVPAACLGRLRCVLPRDAAAASGARGDELGCCRRSGALLGATDAPELPGTPKDSRPFESRPDRRQAWAAHNGCYNVPFVAVARHCGTDMPRAVLRRKSTRARRVVHCFLLLLHIHALPLDAHGMLALCSPCAQPVLNLRNLCHVLHFEPR